jgi:hypothetical protein
MYVGYFSKTIPSPGFQGQGGGGATFKFMINICTLALIKTIPVRSALVSERREAFPTVDKNNMTCRQSLLFLVAEARARGLACEKRLGKNKIEFSYGKVTRSWSVDQVSSCVFLSDHRLCYIPSITLALRNPHLSHYPRIHLTNQLYHSASKDGRASRPCPTEPRTVHHMATTSDNGTSIEVKSSSPPSPLPLYPLPPTFLSPLPIPLTPLKNTSQLS